MAGSERSDQSILGGGIAWPISVRLITRVGDSVTDRRPGSGRPHRGIDIFAAAGSDVLSAGAGKVSRIVDGRFSAEEHRKRAGLYIDIVGTGGLVFRYLHLGSAYVRVGDSVSRGLRIGDVGPAYTSGASDPHLHFEIRMPLGGSSKKLPDGYGQPIAPDRILPPRVS